MHDKTDKTRHAHAFFPIIPTIHFLPFPGIRKRYAPILSYLSCAGPHAKRGERSLSPASEGRKTKKEYYINFSNGE
jgi:hypothetical protein